MGDVIGPTAQVVVGIIALVASIGGASLAGQWNARIKTIEAGTPTYAEMVESVRDLDERVRRAECSLDEEREKRRSLEDRIDHLEDDRRAGPLHGSSGRSARSSTTTRSWCATCAVARLGHHHTTHSRLKEDL